MYNINDKNSAIKELQRLLRINQTGQYDSNTKSAVKEHQEKNNIAVTGITDYETFESVVNEHILYEMIELNKLNLHELPDFPYKYGDSGTNVGVINSILGEIFEEYTIETKLPRGKYFDKDTENAVTRLQAIFMLSETGQVDDIMFARMVDEKNAIISKKSNL